MAAEKEEQGRRSDRLGQGGEDDDRLDQAEQVPPGRMGEHVLDGEALLERSPPTDEAEQNDGDGHDPQAADLNQDQNYRLAGQAEIGPRVDHDQSGDARGRGRGETGRR